MTLDPVHVDGIARLASAIADSVDDSDHTDLAETVWSDWLDPLRRQGRSIVEPVAEQRRLEAVIDDVALSTAPFDSVHGLDSGTINPTTFKNGLVLDVAQAAMASVPTDLDLHRSRSLVATVHASDPTLSFREDWTTYDEGYSRRRLLHAPRVSRFAEGVVHALSLYLAESDHALYHANTVTDLLLLDGPIYPKELLTWSDRDRELAELAQEAKPRQVLENYVRLVETFVDRDVPLAGFVKNPAAATITRTLREKGVEAPWPSDTSLFTRLLERREDGDRLTDRLTFTSWFYSRGGVDAALAADGDALGVERELAPEQYEVAFFVVYDPREDVLYKVETPRVFAEDADVREALTKQILRDVAGARGPPPAIEKADELARVATEEKAALRRKFEQRFDSKSVQTYDDVRWGDAEY